MVAALPGNLWGTLAGDAAVAVSYTTAVSDAYTDDTAVHLRVGAVQTPRIYAYGLDTLEVASSGLIAITVDDVHTLDIVEATGTTVLRGVQDQALALTVSNQLGGTSIVRADPSLTSGPSASMTASYAVSGLTSEVTTTAGSTSSATAVTVSAASSGHGTTASFKASASGNATVSGSDTITLASASIAMNASGPVVLSAGSTTLSVSPSGTVLVDGDLIVTGVYTTVSSTQLHVDEAIIKLATHSNSSVPAAPDESIGPAGVIIASLPTVIPGIRAIANKSLLWNNGVSGTSGLLAPGTVGATDESYWELRGGAFRISATDPVTGTDVGYEFRAGPEGLEIFQVWQSARLGYTKAFKRIGIFHGVPPL